MKKFFCIFLLCAGWLHASSRELIKNVPRDSYIVIAADFSMLRTNDVFQSMERKGQIWSYEQDSEVVSYFKALKIDPPRDVNAFIFSKYLNPYGTSGQLHVFELTREPVFKGFTSKRYLDTPLYQVGPEPDHYAAPLAPRTVAFGDLNEVKMAVDVSHGKLNALGQNARLMALFQKLPGAAAVCGIALPLSRRDAAAAGAKQSTNPTLSAFQSYYFYGLPGNPSQRNPNQTISARGHFFGEASDEKQAALVSTFMMGTIAIAKFRVDREIAEALDDVEVERNGKVIHVTGLVTKEMVDAYFNGNLGVE